MYKIIRDAIHGDITVDEKFLKVIDTKEFQRLRRIKQLSVADVIFPDAVHTRFSHCIGTYHVMSLFIEHFQKLLNEVGVKVFSSDERNLILLAALLHDLGHGSFSHAFEVVSNKLGIEKTHEEWTCDLIISEKTEIHTVIIQEFGVDMPQRVVDVIRHQQLVKKQKSGSLQNLDLSTILSSLISSQLDADRMDYLMRDSFFCGVKFGNIDIQRIIDALQITVKNNQYFVCIPEKFVADIENYILARYQMSKIVYYHDLKLCYEDLIVKILYRAKELFQKGQLETIPKYLQNFFNNKISVEDYLELDDISLISLFQEWKRLDDSILKKMCSQFLYRSNISKAKILDNSNENIENFKSDLYKLFLNYGYQIDDFDKEYFWTEGEKKFNAYSVKKENIFVLRNNGLIVDLTRVSKLFYELSEQTDSGKVLLNDGNAIYINYPLIRFLNIEKSDFLENEIKKLVEQYNVRNNIEIEKKYIVDTKDVFMEVEKFFREKNFSTSEKQKKQKDIYFDTNDNKLLQNKITVRIREIDDENEMTIKLPVNSNMSVVGSERFEYKKNLKNKNEIDNAFLEEHIQIGIKPDLLRKSLIIENDRKTVTVTKESVVLEIAFDSVKYYIPNTSDCREELQIEIELKSSYVHRVNLQILSEELENSLGRKLTITNDSKYKRGLACFGIKA